MSIQSGDGVLEILDGTLKVSRLDIQDVSGLDVAINTIARNMVLLRDDLTAAQTPGGAVTSSTGVTRTQNTDLTFTNGHVYWPIKVPNSWTMQFDVYDNLIFSFANTSTPSSAVASDNHGGYKMVFDSANSWFSFYYQGVEIVATRTAYTTGQWLSVIVNYEYGGISVSIDGRHTMNYALTHGEDAYTGQYIGFASAATGKLRDIKLTNGDKWQYTDGSNASSIAYMNGNVGIGSASPQKTLDVGGDVKISGNLIVAGTTFTVDSQNLSIKDKIIELAGGNTDGDSNVGMIMTTGGSSNVSVGYRGQVGELMIGYTSNIASDAELTPKAGTNLPVKVYGDLEVTRALSGSTVSGDGYLLSNVTLSQVVDYGNTTSNTVQFNATDVALKTVGKVAIGTTTASIDLAIGDANTGLNQEGEDELAVYTGGSERVRVDSSGYVGISTSEPTANLHVVGAQYINDLPLGTGTSSYAHNAAPLTLTSATTTDTTATSVLNLTRPADVEDNVASRASFKVSRWSGDTLTASRSKLDVSLASGAYTNEVTPLTLQANQKVGIMNTSPGHTLSVGTKVWVDENGSNVLTVSGNAYVSNKLTVEAFRISATTFDGLEAVTLAGNLTSSNIEISNTKTSTSQTTGALVVAGGVGIGKDLYTTNVHASSYIGIGAATPEASLHIGPKNTDHIYLASLNNDYGWKLDTVDQGGGDVPFRIIKRTNDTDSTAVTIKNQNGYVGIGTANPEYKLDVIGSVRAQGVTDAAQVVQNTTTPAIVRTLTTGGQVYFQSGTAFASDSRADINFTSMYNGTSYMKIQASNGNVGIGTVSPGAKLQVGGNAETAPQYLWIRGNRVNAAGDICGIHFYNSLSSGDRGNSRIINSRGTNNYGSNLEFWTNPDDNVPALERMRILANGNVGIGTVSPAMHLHVRGTSGGSEIYLGDSAATDRVAIFKYSQGNGTGTGSLNIGHYGTHNTWNYYHGDWYFGGNAIRSYTVNGVLQITSSTAGRMDDAIACLPVGDSNHIFNFLNTLGTLRGRIDGVNSSTVSYVTTSDARLKKNVKPMKSTLNRINSLKPVSYTWVTDEKLGDGFIAQDVFKVFPELRPGLPYSKCTCKCAQEICETCPLCADEHDYPKNEDGTEYMFGLDYGKFTPYLTKAIQELDEKVEEHHNRKSFIENLPYSDVEDVEGLIVSATTNNYKKDKPTLTLSSIENDKKCYGVIVGKTIDSIDSETNVQRSGEGCVWVINTNGPLESGDLITTSNVSGYGMKQFDDILRSCTVSKITQDCDFTEHLKPKKRIKQELRNITYYLRDVYNRIEHIDRGDRSRMLPREELVYENDTEVETNKNDYYTFRKFDPEISESHYDALTEYEKNAYKVKYMRYERISEEKYNALDDKDKLAYEPVTRTIYYIKETRESTVQLPECCGEYRVEIRQELVNVLDEHGQLQWEDDPSGATEKAYKIRYLTADGQITDEANAVHIAAFVGCTYHCG